MPHLMRDLQPVGAQQYENALSVALPLSAGIIPGPGKRQPASALGMLGRNWNRFAIEVDDLPSLVDELAPWRAHFRNEIVTGVGSKQIIVDDPSGNSVEPFEPLSPEARLESGSG
jgi:hypothetical protein